MAIIRAMSPGPASRLRGIEGLRALAAISVLTLHVYLFAPAPTSGLIDSMGIVGRLAAAARGGLMLFFVLSGFLLWTPFARSILSGSQLPPIGAYFRNRALRIVPAYWVILLVTSFVLRTAVTRYHPFAIGSVTDPGVLARDLLFIQGYWISTANTGVAPAWSLCAEVVFYALLPVLGILGAAHLRRPPGAGAALAPAVGLVVLGLAVKGALASHGISPYGMSGLVVSESFPAFADLFGIGMAAAVVFAAVQLGLIRVAPAARVLLGGLGAAVLLILALAIRDHGSAGFRDTAVGLGCAGVLLSIALPAEGRRSARALLESRPVATVGLWSYSVYLWHLPVILLLRRWGVESHNYLTLAGCWLATLGVTLALSAVTFNLVEAPMLRRKRRSSTPVPAQLGLAFIQGNGTQGSGRSRNVQSSAQRAPRVMSIVRRSFGRSLK